MLDRCMSPRRARQVQRIIRNGKITILCLLLTIVVLRGNLGAGKFGTPEKDLKEIQETFSNYIGRRSEPRRVLDGNGYADFGIKKILADEDDGVGYKRDPKISEWGQQQRAEWLKENPRFPNLMTALLRIRNLIKTWRFGM